MLMQRSRNAAQSQGEHEYGALLRRWRSARGLSQLSLATEAGISTRHLSFLENGRSQPSRAMVELLSGMLDLPLGERNTLLLAAGFAPAYGRRPMTAPDLEPLALAFRYLLTQQEPYPALVIDDASNIVERNQSARRIFGLFVSDPPDNKPANTIRSMFHPRGLRQFVVNWEEIAVRVLHKVHRSAASGLNEAAVRLRDEVMQYPGVRSLSYDNNDTSMPPLMAMRLKKGDLDLSFFSTVATLGYPCDVTFESLKVECFFPADNRTDEVVRRLTTCEAALPVT